MFLCILRKVLLVLTLISSVFGVTFSASAQQQMPVVAIVDLQGVIRNSQAGTSIRQQISKKMKVAKSEIKELEDQLNTNRENLLRQRASLSEDAFEKRKSSLENKLIEANREVGLTRQSFDIAYRNASRKIEDKVVSIIEKIASARGANLIMDSVALVLFDPAMDITDEVLDQVNVELPNVTLEFPPAK